jgi:hypothetical protein
LHLATPYCTNSVAKALPKTGLAMPDNKRVFKDAWLRSKIKAGEYWDLGFPGFGLRVSPKGRKTFVLVARYGRANNPARRSLGFYPAISLEKAHAKAEDWIELIQKGVDPAEHEKKIRAEQARKQANTFAAVAQDFANDKLTGERKGKDAEREINLDLMSEWQNKPITEITADDIIGVINKKKRKVVGKTTGRRSHKRMLGGKTGARNLLALVKRLFAWAVGTRAYGLTESPAATLTAKNIIGEDATVSRDRILSDDEIFAFWRATGHMPYPAGPAYRLLMLTALRLNETVRMQRKELDPLLLQRLDNRKENEPVKWQDLPEERSIWTIPKERMKGKNSGKKVARAHVVPTTDEIIGLFAELPRFKGSYLFSTTGGLRPVSIGTKVKAELDRRMLITLRAIARSRGQNPADVTLPHWVNHDVRRTVRSHLSRLKIEEVAREAILAHARPGIKGVYDLHDYREEKREALRLWAARLRSIVEPAPSNVVSIKESLRG